MPTKLVLLTYESWADLYRAIDGLTPEEATTRSHGSSAIAWTLGHVTHMVDSWINTRFQGLPPHPVIDTPDFRAGGGGDALDWPTVLGAAGEVRDAARRFLDTVDDADLDRVIPYDGSIELLRGTGLRLGYGSHAHHRPPLHPRRGDRDGTLPLGTRHRPNGAAGLGQGPDLKSGAVDYRPGSRLSAVFIAATSVRASLIPNFTS